MVLLPRTCPNQCKSELFCVLFDSRILFGINLVYAHRISLDFLVCLLCLHVCVPVPSLMSALYYPKLGGSAIWELIKTCFNFVNMEMELGQEFPRKDVVSAAIGCLVAHNITYCPCFPSFALV